MHRTRTPSFSTVLPTTSGVGICAVACTRWVGALVRHATGVTAESGLGWGCLVAPFLLTITASIRRVFSLGVVPCSTALHWVSLRAALVGHIFVQQHDWAAGNCYTNDGCMASLRASLLLTCGLLMGIVKGVRTCFWRVEGGHTLGIYGVQLSKCWQVVSWHSVFLLAVTCAWKTPQRTPAAPCLTPWVQFGTGLRQARRRAQFSIRQTKHHKPSS